jgi:hypothetical protein
MSSMTKILCQFKVKLFSLLPASSFPSATVVKKDQASITQHNKICILFWKND